MTDNESEVEKLVRSLSFQVLAVPGQSQKVVPSSTSKTAPLNIKIKVRKKHEGGLQHGVLSTPVKGSDEVPQRIRLVSSDQTIMSFNAIMEDIDFDKSREQKLNLPNISNHPCTSSSTGSCQSDSPLKGEFLLSKVEDDTHNKKDIFGRCKPGGCLDPPFGEDKYPYEPAKQHPNIKRTPEKKKTASIFSNKLFKKIKKLKTDKSNVKNDEPELNRSVISLYQSGSLQRSIYSNSIITYPSQSSDEKIFDNKPKSSTNSQIRKSSELDNRSLYIVPKKTRASLEKEYIKQECLSADLVDGTRESNQYVTSGDKAGLISADIVAATAGIAATVLADKTKKKTTPDDTAVGPRAHEYLSDDLVDVTLESKQDITVDYATSGAKLGLISADVTAATAGIAATVLADKIKKETTPDDTPVGPRAHEYLSDDFVDGTLELKQDVMSGAKAGLIAAGVTATTASIAATVVADTTKKEKAPDDTAVIPKTQEYSSDEQVDNTLESKQDVTGDNATSGGKASSSADVTAATAGIAATVLADETKKETASADDTAVRPKTQEYLSDYLVDGTLEPKQDVTNGAKSGLIAGGVAATTAGIAATVLADTTKKKATPDDNAVEPKTQEYSSNELVDGNLESKQDVTSETKASLISAGVAATTASIAATVLADKTKKETAPDDTAVGPKTQEYLSDDLVDGTLEPKQEVTSEAKAGLIAASVADTTAGITATVVADKTKKKTTPDDNAVIPKIQEYSSDELVDGNLETKQDVTSGAKAGLISADVTAASAGIAATVLADKTKSKTTPDDAEGVKRFDNDNTDFEVLDTEIKKTISNKTDKGKAIYLNTEPQQHDDMDDKISENGTNILRTEPAIQQYLSKDLVDSISKSTDETDDKINEKGKNILRTEPTTEQYLSKDIVDSIAKSSQDDAAYKATNGGTAGFIPTSGATAVVAATIITDKTKMKTTPDDTALVKPSEVGNKDLEVGDRETNNTISNKLDKRAAGYLNTEPQNEGTDTGDKTNYKEKPILCTGPELKQDNTVDNPASSGNAGFIPASVATATTGIVATLLADSNFKKATSADDPSGLNSSFTDDIDFKVSDNGINKTIINKSDGNDAEYLNTEQQQYEITDTDIKKKYSKKNMLRTDSENQDYLPHDQVDSILKSKQDNTGNDFMSRSKAKIYDNDRNKTISNTLDEKSAEHSNTARQQDTLNEDNYKGTNVLHTNLDIQEYLSNHLVDSTLAMKQDDTRDNATSEPKAGSVPSSAAAATTSIVTIFSADSKNNIKKTIDDNSFGLNLSHDDNHDLMFDKNEMDKTDKSRESKQSGTRDDTPSGNESTPSLMPPGIITATSGVVPTLLPSSLLDINDINKTTIGYTWVEQLSENDNGEMINERTKENHTYVKTKYDQLSTNTTDYKYADANEYEGITSEFSGFLSNKHSFKQEYVTEETMSNRNKFLTKTEDTDTGTLFSKDFGSIKDKKGSYSESLLSRLNTNVGESNSANQNISVQDNINDNVSKSYEDILSDLKSQKGLQEILEKENEFVEVDRIDDTKWEYVSDFEHINGKRLKLISENDEVTLDDVVKISISQLTIDRRDVSPDKLGSDNLSKEKIKKHQINATPDLKTKEDLNKKTGHSNIEEIFQNDRIKGTLKKPIKATSGDSHKKGREPREQTKTKIDLGFHTYTNKNKQLVVKSFDSRTLPNRYPNDSVIIAKCDLKEPFYLKVPLGTEQYLLFQIKDNENLSKIVPSPTKSSKISVKGKEQNIRQHQIINEQINSTVKNATRAVKSINKDIVRAHMKDIYGTYKNELVPVQESLTRLKQDIHSLILQQKTIRANLLSKRKCGCVKKM